MRLTLRTMLAYLDGILEPEDAQDIAKKIEVSVFASDLMHRIRDLARRIRLAPPGMRSEIPATDAETVAEYLDNTLPPAQVMEFEKSCLESDIQLAEVAACHQVLTLVLCEPAEVDPATRQKIYELPARYPEIPYFLAHGAVMPPPLPSNYAEEIGLYAEEKTPAKPTIPEYLREPKKNYRWISLATAIGLSLCVVIVLLKSLGWFEPGATVAIPAVVAKNAEENKQESTAANKGGATSPKTAADTTPTQKTDKAVEPKGKPATESATVSTAPVKQPAESAKQSVAGQSSVPAAVSDKKESASAPEPADKAAEVPSKNEAPTHTADVQNSSIPAVLPEPASEKRPREETLITPGSVKTAETSEIAKGGSVSKALEEQSPPVVERLGRLISDDQALLRYASPGGDWQRVASQESLSTGQQILALPTYRPEIKLNADASMQMLGPASLELLPGNSNEPAGIKLRFGRIVLRPLADAGTRLRITIGPRAGVLTFSDPEAAVAIEVRRIPAPGANPETEPGHLESELFVTSGRLVWEEPAQKMLEIAAPSRVKLYDQLPAEQAALKQAPEWINSDPLNKLEQGTAEIIVQSLKDAAPMRSVKLALMELAEKHRRKEVRWLAIRCLGYLDYFDPLAMVLDDAAFKNEWNDYIEQLQAAVCRDPETAAAVRQTLEKRYPQIAADLYRMLWGYADKDLASGEDAQLVKYLEDENLALRVLSSWNLKEITGKTLSYQPEQTPVKRQQPIVRWKQSLEANDIRIKSAEEKAGNAADE